MKLFSNSNSKLKKDGIYSFGLPAKKTCPNAGTCKQFCYASKNFYLMPSVKQAQSSRLALTKNLQLFALVADAEIKKRNICMLRIHDSGDFYNQAYLDTWFRVMRSNPTVRFYAYTKQVQLLKSVRERWPENFTVIFSFGGRQDGLIDTARDRHARIFDTEEQLNRAGYVNGSDTDMVAAAGIVKRIGLVRH